MVSLMVIRGFRIRQLMVVGFFLLSCSFGGHTNRIGKPRQATVDAFAALTTNLKYPEHFTKGISSRVKDDFDVNSYFSVLTHLSMEPGYVLDYIYHSDGLGGKPLIYARRSTQPPYPTYDEFLNAVGGSEQFSFEFLEHSKDYLKHIRIDNATDGFFEFVLLSTMGDEFYLSWHGGYNDVRIVCDRHGADAALASVETNFKIKVLHKVRQAVRKIDFEPAVEFVGDSAKVRFITFTKWGGFREIKCTISRTFPHTISNSQEKVLLPYDCGVRF
jgi:hypothetical protein